MSSDYSRTLRLASNATGSDHADLEQRLAATSVHISAEISIDGVDVALRHLTTNLRRLPLQVSVSLVTADDRGARIMREQLTDLARAIDPVRGVRFTDPPAGATIVHIGPNPTTQVLIAGVPDGHGVRLRLPGEPFPRIMSTGTGLGGFATAAWLTAEVFKAVVGLPIADFPSARPLDWCPVARDRHPGRLVPTLKPLDRTVLAGCGAIGTAITAILRELAATGSLFAVDPQVFDEPNLTTYSLGTVLDAERHSMKVDLVKQALPGVHVTGVQGTVLEFLHQIDVGQYAAPLVALGGLDSRDARHELSRLHADLTLDGSTGGRIGTTIGLREGTWTGPCLRCFYPIGEVQSASPTVADVTGLPAHLTGDGDRIVDADLLEAASPEGRERLRGLLGERVCSLPELLGLVPGAGDYRPSAVFVAQLAAVLVVGSLLAHQSGHRESSLAGAEVEFDALFGWVADAEQPRRATDTCTCQRDRELIAAVREFRSVEP